MFVQVDMGVVLERDAFEQEGVFLFFGAAEGVGWSEAAVTGNDAVARGLGIRILVKRPANLAGVARAQCIGYCAVRGDGALRNATGECINILKEGHVRIVALPGVIECAHPPSRRV